MGCIQYLAKNQKRKSGKTFTSLRFIERAYNRWWMIDSLLS